MIEVIDETLTLTPREISRLSKFVTEKCFSCYKDRSWLKYILVVDDGDTGYEGYWTWRMAREGAWMRRFETVIVLNATYLPTVDEMEKVLAHEYGHNWTLGYLAMWEILEDFDKQRAPWLYYRIRNLDPKEIAPDEGLSWDNCDKELLAEDYRCLLTPYKDDHCMETKRGLPSAEVRTYLERLGRPIWER